MSRSGYNEDYDYNYLNLYRNTVERALAGKRGQKFLLELRDAMDRMPVKRLIYGELVDANGECCTIGVVCKARGLDAKKIEYEFPEDVGRAVGISTSMAAEIEYENDQDFRSSNDETPEQRWTRMRKWVDEQLKEGQVNDARNA